MAKAKPTVKSQQDATVSASQEIDRQLAQQATEKQKRGEATTRDEREALRRWERAEDERRRWEHYRSIPQKHWREMSGRAAKVINEQADRYGLPFSGRTIDLTAFVRAFHEFLAENAHALSARCGTGSPKDAEIQRLRRAQADRAEMENATARGQLRHLDEVRRTFEFVADAFRKASAELRTEFGPRAFEILESAVEDAKRIVEKFENQKPKAESDRSNIAS